MILTKYRSLPIISITMKECMICLVRVHANLFLIKNNVESSCIKSIQNTFISCFHQLSSTLGPCVSILRGEYSNRALGWGSWVIVDIGHTCINVFR